MNPIARGDPGQQCQIVRIVGIMTCTSVGQCYSTRMVEPRICCFLTVAAVGGLPAVAEFLVCQMRLCLRSYCESIECSIRFHICVWIGVITDGRRGRKMKGRNRGECRQYS